MKKFLSMALIGALFCTVNNNGFSEELTINSKIVNNDIKPINQRKLFNKLDNAIDLINIHSQVPKTFDTAHPSAGLENVGATCYMNATLQDFASLSYFVKSLFKQVKTSYSKLIKTPEGIFTLEFANVIAEIITKPFRNALDPTEFTSDTHYAPKSFKDVLSKINPLFEGVQANDSKDLLITILETLHNALNKPNNTNNTLSINIDQRNYQQVFNNFSSEFISQYNSVISRYFDGIRTQQMQCANCNNIQYSCQLYNMLIFPLEEVRKMKYGQNAPYLLPQNSPIDLYDCFIYNQKTERFFGSNQIYCNNCKRQSNAQYRTILEYTPNILHLILNRGKANMYNVKIDIPEFANFNNFTNKKIDDGIYYLSAFVCHMGESSMAGHFVAITRKSPNAPWYMYNDSSTYKYVNENDVKQILNGSDNRMTPYIVTYTKM